MEIRANEAFDVYRELYYEGGVSSVYFWNLDDGFAGVVLLKKGNFAFHKISNLGYMVLIGNSCYAGWEKPGDLGFDPCV
jgi:F-actin capping protein, beta subunit